MTLPEASTERCPRCKARRVADNPLCAQCGWRFKRNEPKSSPQNGASSLHSEPAEDATPQPIVSPDGRHFWDGQKWVVLPRRGRSIGGVLLFLILALAVVAGVGTSGYVDLSGLPVSVPIVLEHCAIRYEDTNVIIHYQGIDAQAACRRVHPGWLAYVGPPVGSLTCYRQRPLGLTWKVYDTGTMALGSEMCGRLADEDELAGRR